VAKSATPRIRFASPTSLPLEGSFDAGRLTSDGGLPWLAEAERVTQICARFAGLIPDWRRAGSRHSLAELIRQRVFQIACGYEDQNDAATLRTDPLLKVACGRLPETGADLASQPTFSRLENAVDWRTCYRLAVALAETYVRERERAGIPDHILLDLDTTDDATYGKQEATAYHGYYREHMYHPLFIFDGETDQLVVAVLRPGNAHASRGVRPILRRLIRLLRARWPGVRIEIRADSGFAVHKLYTFCEREGVGYTIGLIPNPRLEREAAALLAEARRQSLAQGGTKVRLMSEVSYQAGTWDRARRVVYKAETLEKGPNTRFVVTTRTDDPTAVYDWYVDRGEPELWIKDLKNACFGDRMSCHRFVANQFRLLLHAAAYWLLDTLRRWLIAAGAARLQLDTLRLRLLKIAGRVRQLGTIVRLHLATSHPGELLWLLLSTHPRRS
jgi:hypothetical protein